MASRIGDEKLRKQLFGKAWKDVGRGGGGVGRGEVGRGRAGSGSAGHVASKARPTSSHQGRIGGDEDDEEEEEGRSSLGKSKKRRAVAEVLNTKVVQPEIKGQTAESDDSGDGAQTVTSHERSPGRGSVGGGSYLDQVLSERATKKTKKRNRNKKRKKNESADAS